MSRKHSKPLTISEAVGAANNAPLSGPVIFSPQRNGALRRTAANLDKTPSAV